MADDIHCRYNSLVRRLCVGLDDNGDSDWGLVIIFGVQSVFVLQGSLSANTMLELTWSGGQRYETNPFLSGLSKADGLAVDSRGDIYFGARVALNTYAIYRATPAGVHILSRCASILDDVE